MFNSPFLKLYNNITVNTSIYPQYTYILNSTIFQTIDTGEGTKIISSLKAKKIAQDELTTSLVKQELVLKTDENELRKLEKEIAKGVSYEEAFASSINKASISAREYAIQTKGASGSTDVFISKQRTAQAQLKATANASKTASIAMKTLSIAANMFVTGLIIKGLELVGTTISNYIHRVEKANEQINETRSNYNELISSIESMNSELKTTQDKIKDLQSKGTLSFTDKAELDNLKEQNDELERSIKLEEKKKSSEAKKTVDKIRHNIDDFSVDFQTSIDSLTYYKKEYNKAKNDYLEATENGWINESEESYEGTLSYYEDNLHSTESTVTVISKYEQLEKIIVKADNELRNLQRDLAEIKAYDSNASTTNIEAKISDQKEYIRLLEQTVKVISQSDEYLLDEQQIIDARNKAAREYALTMGSKQEKTDAKQSASDEKKRLANIEQVNRALNKQQITIDAIEKTYNKSTNPDLDREVSNQQDLAELAQKKLDIQTKINSLQGQERNSANEKDFLELEKLIAEYKELAKYKLKANNPSKQELGGQNLQTLIQVQISNYDKLITKAEKYGDATTDTVEKLKEQRDILSKIGADGKYTATADQYYSSRDTYKVESAALSAFEAETKAIEQKTQAVKRLKDELEGYNNQIPKKPVDGQRSDKFEGFVQKYREAIDEARRYLNTLGDSPITEEVLLVVLVCSQTIRNKRINLLIRY